MKAAVVHTLSRPPCYQDFPEPTPHETEIPIQVRAAGCIGSSRRVPVARTTRRRARFRCPPALTERTRLQGGFKKNRNYAVTGNTSGRSRV